MEKNHTTPTTKIPKQIEKKRNQGRKGEKNITQTDTQYSTWWRQTRDWSSMTTKGDHFGDRRAKN